MCQSVWIITAWQQHISPQLAVMGIWKCCAYSVMDGNDGDMLWNDRGVCEGDGGTDCEGGERVTVTGSGRHGVTCVLSVGC
jgi:hypothetical protein